MENAAFPVEIRMENAGQQNINNADSNVRV
jgi:hypothetical protein